MDKIKKFAEKMTEPLLTVALFLANGWLAVGYVLGLQRDPNIKFGMPVALVGLGYLLNGVFWERVLPAINRFVPELDLTLTSEQVFNAWLAQAALIGLGVVLAQLKHVVAGGWSWNGLELPYRPALTLCLALPFVVLVNVTDVRAGDPVAIWWNIEDHLRNLTPEQIERFNLDYEAFREHLESE